jgi:hypothetical protein
VRVSSLPLFSAARVGGSARSLRQAALLAPPPCVLEDLAELTVGFVVHVASVCLTCFRCLTRMLQEFRADVAKVDLDFSTLRMLIPQHKRLIPNVATICFRMLWILQLILTYF